MVLTVTVQFLQLEHKHFRSQMIASRFKQKQKKLSGSWTYLSILHKFEEYLVLTYDIII